MPVIEGDSSKGWTIAIASNRGLKGGSRELSFAAIPPCVTEKMNFVFLTELRGSDDWGNPVKTVHEMVVDVIPR